jgi:hypothetical protein
VKISGQRGDITLNSITGAAKINLERGSLRASNITGDIAVDGRMDDVTLDEINGSARLNGVISGAIRVSKITKDFAFKSERSDITLASVPGDLDISGDSLRGTDLKGPSRLVMRSREIHLEDVSGDLEVETTNGEIKVHTAEKAPVGRITLKGKKGDISLVLPSNAGFQMDATTRKGDISSDFGNLNIDQHDGGVSKATGTVGNGAGKVTINADVGDVKISKG